MLPAILRSADKRARLADASLEALQRDAQTAPPVRDFRRALLGPELAVIAEIKRRSPSVGDIDTSLDPVALARAYAAGGAAAISVLTEPDYFGGSLADLAAVRAAVDVPVLRKDFTRSPAQIWEARSAGADAVLLIVAALEREVLGQLLATARTVGVTAIVEVHTIDEVSVAVEAGAEVIGVNNRDLHSFVTDLSVAESAADHLPAHVVTIGESGVSDAEGARRMRQAGYDAILVGEALVRAQDPGALLGALRAAR